MRKLGIIGLQGNSCWVGVQVWLHEPPNGFGGPPGFPEVICENHCLGPCYPNHAWCLPAQFPFLDFFSRPLKACSAVLGWTGDRLGSCLHEIIITMYDDLCEGQVVSWRPHGGWADLWEEARLKWSFFLGDRRGRRTLEVFCAGGRGQIHGSLGDMAEIRIRGIDEGSVIQEIGSPIKILVLNL